MVCMNWELNRLKIAHNSVQPVNGWKAMHNSNIQFGIWAGLIWQIINPLLNKVFTKVLHTKPQSTIQLGICTGLTLQVPNQKFSV